MKNRIQITNVVCNYRRSFDIKSNWFSIPLSNFKLKWLSCQDIQAKPELFALQNAKLQLVQHLNKKLFFD